jgi:UDP-glucose 4-epimerase
MQSVLVTGGAGFIGSHTVRLLLAQGYEVTVIDDLRQGHPDSVPEGILEDLNLFDAQEVADLMQDRHCTSVLHLAASTSVAESMLEPGVYFNNNVAGSLGLLQAMMAAGVTRLVFSSSGSGLQET